MNCLSYIDALIVSAPEAGITPTPVSTIVPGGTYEDSAAQVVYSGTWTTYSNTGPSGGNLHYTASAGSSASLSFNGSHVTLVYAGINGYGHADIFIDGTLVTRLNQSTAALTWQKTWTSPLLTPGYHTIRVAYVDGYYNVDAFIVRGLSTATPTATAYTPSPTPSRTNTPIPPSTSTFTPTATNAPTATPTPLASEPAPQALTGAQYAYDGDGTLMRGTVNGVTTFYPGRHYNKEISPSGTKIQKFYFAGTVTIAVRTLTDSAETLTWVLGDHLGSASTTANENGSLNSVIQYTAFGEIRLTQGITPTKYRYTGQLAQAELGLDYYVARWYDPYLNHWIQPDSIIPDPSKTQSFDRYAYVDNSPIIFNDPLGHDVGCAGREASECQGGINKLNNKQIQKKVYEKYKNLYTDVLSGNLDDLQAFKQLSDYTASFSANDPDSFERNMGAVLTGLSEGNSAVSEALNQANVPFVKRNDLYVERKSNDEQLLQSGFAGVFKDPNVIRDPNLPTFGGDQPHHFWFYVQVSYESGSFVSNVINTAHESIIGDKRGMSKNDFALGFEGSIIGDNLRSGKISPLDVGNAIDSNLRPNSSHALLWFFLWGGK